MNFVSAIPSLTILTSLILTAGCDFGTYAQRASEPVPSSTSTGEQGENADGSSGSETMTKSQKMKNIRAVALAVLNFESVNKSFPFSRDARNKNLSWYVDVLPYLKQKNMFDSMDPSSGPGAEQNRQFAEQMPAVFGNDAKNTNIIHVQSEAKGFSDMTDGSSNTIMLIEHPAGSPWLKNKSLTADEVVAMFAKLKPGESRIVAMYDSSIETITQGIDEQTLRNLLTPNDGNVIAKGWNE